MLAVTNYRRNFIRGGSFFFTANLAERRLRLLVDYIDLLRQAAGGAWVNSAHSSLSRIGPDMIQRFFALTISLAIVSIKAGAILGCWDTFGRVRCLVGNILTNGFLRV
jgi:hypothetical protein